MKSTIPRGAAILLAFIYQTETSRAAPACYDVIYGHNQDKLAKPLTSMTYGEVVDAQRSWTKRFGSSAAGAPQFMRRTLIDLAKANLWLEGDQLFDADLQDELAYKLLIRRGYDLFVAGRMTRTEFGKRLAQEWASFPVLANTDGDKRAVLRGQSYYAGDGLNKSLTSPEKVEAILDKVKQIANASPPEQPSDETVIVEKPVIADPGELAKPVGKSKTFWTWLLTAIGTPFVAFGGLDWRVQLVIVVVIVGFAIYGIKRRNDLAKAYRLLKAEFGT